MFGMLDLVMEIMIVILAIIPVFVMIYWQGKW